MAPGDSALAGDVTARPPNPNPPPYTLLRYTENYSYLGNPDNRTDFFDPVKYSGDQDDYSFFMSMSDKNLFKFAAMINRRVKRKQS